MADENITEVEREVAENMVSLERDTVERDHAADTLQQMTADGEQEDDAARVMPQEDDAARVMPQEDDAARVMPQASESIEASTGEDQQQNVIVGMKRKKGIRFSKEQKNKIEKILCDKPPPCPLNGTELDSLTKKIREKLGIEEITTTQIRDRVNKWRAKMRRKSSTAVELIKCKEINDKFVSLRNARGEDIADGIVLWAEGKWQGRKVDEQDLCFVEIKNIVERWKGLLEELEVCGNITKGRAEVLNGKMIVVWDRSKIHVIGDKN